MIPTIYSQWQSLPGRTAPALLRRSPLPGFSGYFTTGGFDATTDEFPAPSATAGTCPDEKELVLKIDRGRLAWQHLKTKEDPQTRNLVLALEQRRHEKIRILKG